MIAPWFARFHAMVGHIFYFSCALGGGIHLRLYGVTFITPGLYTFNLSEVVDDKFACRQVLRIYFCETV